MFHTCNRGQEELPQGNWRNPEETLTNVCCVSLSPPVTEALQVQQKLDETTKLLRDLQEAQKERLSAKQPPNMICLLAPTAKEVELGKSLSGHVPLFLCSTATTNCRPNNTIYLLSSRPTILITNISLIPGDKFFSPIPPLFCVVCAKNLIVAQPRENVSE